MLSKLAWYWPWIVYTIETGLCLLLVVLFTEETCYDRTISPNQQLPRSNRFQLLTGIAQRRAKQPSNTFLEAMMRPIKVISKPVILLTNAYYLLILAWAVGINVTLSQFLTTSYNFTFNGIGKSLFFLNGGCFDFEYFE